MKSNATVSELSAGERKDLLARLEAHPEKLWSLGELERTGGKPDVVSRDEPTGEHIFCDCSPEPAVQRPETS